MEAPAGSEISKPERMGPEGIEEMVEPSAKSNPADMEKSNSEEVEKSNSEEVEKFKPGWRLLAAFISIAVVNLATALDATIISVALPVSLLI